MDRRLKTIQQLARQLSRIERSYRESPYGVGDKERGTGIAPLDVLLPQGGFRPGSLVEWLSPNSVRGAGILAFLVAAHYMRRGGNLVVVDPSGEFYPVAAEGLGMELQRTVVVYPQNERDTFWAYEQALRCAGVAVAVCSCSQLNDRVFRRLQLAAEQGGGLGLLLRGTHLGTQPSWADIQIKVTPLGGKAPHEAFTGMSGRHFKIELLRCRGGGAGRGIELELNDETGAMCLVAKLAAAKVACRATGA